VLFSFSIADYTEEHHFGNFLIEAIREAGVRMGRRPSRKLGLYDEAAAYRNRA
jgi:hypothetical protein